MSLLPKNTMRLGHDTFAFSAQAKLEAQQPIDTTNQTDITGIVVGGVEPTGTLRRFLFKVDDALYKFVNGVPVAYSGSDDVEDILENGNTATELAAVTSIQSWCNKQIYPIIALKAPAGASVLPTAKISFNCVSTNAQYTKSEESAEFELQSIGGTPTIIDITASTTCTGNGSVEVKVALLQGEEWTDYMALTDAKNKEAKAVKYKCDYKITSFEGLDTAKVDSIVIRYTTGANSVSGDTAEIYSVTQNYETGLAYVNVLVKHKPLIDSRISAFVSFRKQTKKRSVIPIGTANGSLQTLTLGLDGVKDTGIDQNTLQVQVNGKMIIGYSYNIETSQITLTAEAGAAITASYEYEYEKEEWREMTLQSSEVYKDSGAHSTRFVYTLPEDDQVNEKTISNMKIVLFKPSGHVNGDILGIATGLKQVFALPHKAKKESIICENCDWSYDEDSQIITLTAENGTEIAISYDWVGESPEVYGFTCGWAITA